MYLFILESIGTPELVLIGIVALIVFGPRKLPDLARSFGKAMNEFRRSTSEFKQTWEKEVTSEVNQIKNETSFSTILEDTGNPANSIEKNTVALKNQIVAPEIKEVSSEDFHGQMPSTENLTPEDVPAPADSLASKQNWL